MGFYTSYIKPSADFFVAMLLMLFTLPIIIFLLFLLFMHFRSNPIFKQIRPGLNGRLFSVFKFRTMSNELDSDGNLLPDEQRLTSIGKMIRGLSLDELLQLFNVIKGDMSFVGPRPLLAEYLPLYTKKHAIRHDVKPGITGWAQVNGRNSISWEEKFNLDVWYVDKQSFSLDLKILFMTIMKVLNRDGISSETSVTMEKFKGN